MKHESFTFKQFVVRQERCAMKVGTDGVLLGAWGIGGKRILDIGTGTGLIALMMAQRFPESMVDGVEIDTEAYLQALDNIGASPFSTQINLYNVSLQKYQAECKYDAIVSNPPFFINALKAPDSSRSMARHADTLTYEDLFYHARRLLAEDGKFSVIIPVENVGQFLSISSLSGFYVSREVLIKTVQRKAPKRCLLEFVLHQPESVEKALVTLADEGGERSEWYEHLTKDFYL
uniref:tRNA1(Val) (adenine(37)-N6)-methyltransferase n=1 Tax=Prevotella sp. GTC17253 TaxID=3236793 RepID=A0AB33IQP3_9BACT